MCDKKNSVLFTDTRCSILSFDFKLADESHVFLKVPKKNNMYNVDMKNIVPKKSLTCLFAKATLDESMIWHRRLVVIDDYSRFTWVFFLASKDETSDILKNFITEIENLVDKKVKIIRCDNGTKFKNRVMSEFYEKEGIDYDEVFAPVARIEAIRLFLAYTSFMGFMVYHMDVNSAFLYGRIEEEVYVCQPLWFEDHDHPDKV
ncbi:ribonuclease H-like domain-containing protein [Tanacetum coccineum]